MHVLYQVTLALEELCMLSVLFGNSERALQLANASSRLRRQIGSRPLPIRRAVLDEAIRTAQTQLSPTRRRLAAMRGLASPITEIVQEILGVYHADGAGVRFDIAASAVVPE